MTSMSHQSAYPAHPPEYHYPPASSQSAPSYPQTIDYYDNSLSLPCVLDSPWSYTHSLDHHQQVSAMWTSKLGKVDELPNLDSVDSQENHDDDHPVGTGKKKKKACKSSYKHIPHCEKPVHLVAKRNARERKRVQAVNMAFVKLRKCVPVENRNKRLSKVKTLHRAIEYIQALSDTLGSMDQPQSLGPSDDPSLCQSSCSSSMSSAASGNDAKQFECNQSHQSCPQYSQLTGFNHFQCSGGNGARNYSCDQVYRQQDPESMTSRHAGGGGDKQYYMLNVN